MLSSFAANAFAQITGEIGVAVASSGPGACNLINGIANAYYDSIPCIFITGNVHTKAIKDSEVIRQNGFQETDIVSIVNGIAKFTITVKNPEDIRYYWEKALYFAKQGRPGPVLLDIPYDIQRCKIDVENLHGYTRPEESTYDNIDSRYLADLLKVSKKPILLLGGGARSKECRKKIIKLLEKVEIPAVASLCGLDVLPHNHKCFIGFIGSYGNRYANLAVANSDLLIVIGSRLDERQIGGLKSEFAQNAKIIHVDIDKVELGRTIDEALSIYSSAEVFIGKLLTENFNDYNYIKWMSVLLNWKARYPSYNSFSPRAHMKPFQQHQVRFFDQFQILIHPPLGDGRKRALQGHGQSKGLADPLVRVARIQDSQRHPVPPQE